MIQFCLIFHYISCSSRPLKFVNYSIWFSMIISSLLLMFSWCHEHFSLLFWNSLFYSITFSVRSFGISLKLLSSRFATWTTFCKSRLPNFTGIARRSLSASEHMWPPLIASMRIVVVKFSLLGRGIWICLEFFVKKCKFLFEYIYINQICCLRLDFYFL